MSKIVFLLLGVLFFHLAYYSGAVFADKKSSKNWQSVMNSPNESDGKKLFEGFVSINKNEQVKVDAVKTTAVAQAQNEESLEGISEQVQARAPSSLPEEKIINPKERYESFKSSINDLEDNPIEQAQVFSKMTRDFEMKPDQLKEDLLQSLHARPVPVGMKIEDVKNMSDELKYMTITPEESAFYIKYDALFNVMTNKKEFLDQSLQIFKEQQNPKIKKYIASFFLEKKGEETDEFIDGIGLALANSLAPMNVEIKGRFHDGYQLLSFYYPIKK